MSKKKEPAVVEIPQEAKDFAQALVLLARKYRIRNLRFDFEFDQFAWPEEATVKWGNKITGNWEQGRHGAQEEIGLYSEFRTHLKETVPTKEALENAEPKQTRMCPKCHLWPLNRKTGECPACDNP